MGRHSRPAKPISGVNREATRGGAVSRSIRPEVPAFLAAKLTRIGRNSFVTLCDQCGGAASETRQTPLCHELAYWFDLLATSEVTLSSERKVHIRSLDSYESALGGLTPADLKKIEAEAESLVQTINRLKTTPLVRDMAQRGMIPAGDLLGGVVDLPCGAQFDTLLRLREIAKMRLGNPGNPRKVDFDSDLARVYRFIRQHSAGWHDERVADILNDLFSDRPEPFTQSGLKQWRWNHGLTR
jgi:hypothetical protein